MQALNRVKEVRHPFVLSMDRIEIVEGEVVLIMELADKSLHDLYEECISTGLVGIPRELGSGLQSAGTTTLGEQRKSRLTRALEQAAAQLAEQWDQHFNAAAASLMEHPGRRIALAEAALHRFLRYCREATEAHQQRLQQQASQSQSSQKQLQYVLDNCIRGGGGFSWFGGKSRRLLRVFVDHLAVFARQCLAEDTRAAVQQFYGFLQGRLADRLRDLTFCRQRLRHMQRALSESPGSREGSNELRQKDEDGGGSQEMVYTPHSSLLTRLKGGQLHRDPVHRIILGVNSRIGNRPRRASRPLSSDPQWGR